MKNRDKLKFIMENTTFKEGTKSETAEKVLEYTKDLNRTLKIMEFYIWEEIITGALAVLGIAIVFILTGQIVI